MEETLSRVAKIILGTLLSLGCASLGMLYFL
jgi:hypothetical protein